MKLSPVIYARAYLSAVAGLPESKRRQVASNLWHTVWRRGHFKWTKDILKNVRSLTRESQGIIKVEVASPQPLTDQQQKDLVEKLAKSIGQKVELNCTVKPHLLAGVVMTIDDTRYDASLKGRLEALSGVLAGYNKST